MVDLAEIQAAYYMVAATGVLVAAAYYVLNMRAAERNKKIQLTTSISEKLSSKEFNRDWIELGMLRWNDVDDFLKKYDSSVNTDESRENWAQRWSMWGTYDNLGYLLREGLVDEKIMFNSMGFSSVMFFGRCYAVIEYYRRRELGPRWLENFEYLARRMWVLGREHGFSSSRADSTLLFDRYRNIYESVVSPQ